MAIFSEFNGVLVDSSELVPEGCQVLWLANKPVWSGPLGGATEDVEYDRVTVHPEDYARIRDACEVVTVRLH